MPPSESRVGAGFTLLEVLVAMALFAIVVTTLAPIVMEANLSEGASRRRAEASLYADRLLAEVDESDARGTAPQLGKRELSEGPFRATLETSAFDPSGLHTQGDGAGSLPKRGEPPAQAQSGWLDAPGTRENPPVIELLVRVAWDEGQREQEVRRRSYFLNPAALDALENAQPKGGEPPQ